MMQDSHNSYESQQQHRVSQLFQREVFGMRFCRKCKNLMKPFHGNGHLLDFLCERCNKTTSVDYSEKLKDECLLYSKELQVGSRKCVPEIAYIFDPTIPKVEVECPECGFNRAIYLLAPDEGETKMIAVLICASSSGTIAKCGHTWLLGTKAELLQTRIRTEEEKIFESFDIE